MFEKNIIIDPNIGERMMQVVAPTEESLDRFDKNDFFSANKRSWAHILVSKRQAHGRQLLAVHVRKSDGLSIFIYTQ